jgi:hypothetical protein
VQPPNSKPRVYFFPVDHFVSVLSSSSASSSSATSSSSSSSKLVSSSGSTTASSVSNLPAPRAVIGANKPVQSAMVELNPVVDE